MVSRSSELAADMEKGSFELRLADALRRRLYPNTALRLKEVAAGIGRSENTVARWWRGETRIGGEDLDRLAQYLKKRGDGGFLAEVYGDAFGDTTVADARLNRMVGDFIAQLDDYRRETPAATWWFTEDGAIVEAPHGHAAYVRYALNLSDAVGDLMAYAARVLGWIAVTEYVGGKRAIHHDGHHIAPLAAEHACDWLERGLLAPEIHRYVHVDGAWLDAGAGAAPLASAAIAKAAFIARVPRRPWQVKPLSLDTVRDSLLKSLLKVHKREPGNLINAAAGLGAFATSSLFHVRADDVFSHHIATAFGFDARAIVGQNIMSRPDTDYALMVRARVLKTLRDGATYHELTGTIENYHCRYLNLSLPEPGPDGRVLTSTVVIEAQKVA